MSNIKSILIIFLLFSISLYFYNIVPDKMAIHWDLNLNSDTCVPKEYGLLIIPLTVVAINLFFYIIPKIDPFKKNFEKFKYEYKNFLFVLSLFLLFVHIQIIIWNLSINPNINLIMLGSALLVYQLGLLCEKSKRNWFVGIRTPWTLSNEKVWDKTNKLAAKLFKINASLFIPSAFFNNVFLSLIPFFLSFIFLIFYSYFEYRKL